MAKLSREARRASLLPKTRGKRWSPRSRRCSSRCSWSAEGISILPGPSLLGATILYVQIAGAGPPGGVELACLSGSQCQRGKSPREMISVPAEQPATSDTRLPWLGSLLWHISRYQDVGGIPVG